MGRESRSLFFPFCGKAVRDHFRLIPIKGGHPAGAPFPSFPPPFFCRIHFLHCSYFRVPWRKTRGCRFRLLLLFFREDTAFRTQPLLFFLFPFGLAFRHRRLLPDERGGRGLFWRSAPLLPPIPGPRCSVTLCGIGKVHFFFLSSLGLMGPASPISPIFSRSKPGVPRLMTVTRKSFFPPLADRKLYCPCGFPVSTSKMIFF